MPQKGPDGEQKYCSLSLTLACRRGWVVNATPQPLYPWETHYPLYRRLGGTQG